MKTINIDMKYSEIKFAIDCMKNKMTNAELVISQPDVEADKPLN